MVDMDDDRHLADDDRHLEVTNVAVTIWSIEPPSDAERSEHGTNQEDAERGKDPEPSILRTDVDRTILRLKIGLATAIAAILALAGALYVVRHQSTEERLVEDAIAAYTKAWNAHDVAGVRAAMSANATFAASDSLDRGTLFSAYVGPELERALTQLFNAGAKLETTSKVLIAGDNPDRASVAQRFQYTVYGLSVSEDGLSQFTLTRGTRGRLLIAQHIFWRPWAPRSPSMLWILNA
jgi:hypothetical protein